jgi:chromosome segregation ATPase
MSSASSPRIDSAVSMQEMEIRQLKQQVEQLGFSEQTVKQECEEWKRKHQDQKLEVSRLSGTSSQLGRHVKSIEDRCSELDVQLVNRTKEATELRNDLSKAQQRIREVELQTKTSYDSDRSTSVEFDSLRSQFTNLQQEHSKLKQAHEACTDAVQHAADQVANALQLQEAAEAEMQACRHLQKANEVTKEQSLVVKKQVLEIARELRITQCNFSELEKAVEVQHALKAIAENRVAELEADLRKWEPNSDDWAAKLNALAHDSSSHTNSLNDLSEASSSDATIISDPGLTANIVIDINPSDQKNWTLLKRVQSAMSKASKLDVSGPPDLVADFLAEIQRLEADHAEQTTSAAHWQTVALKCMTEIDSLSAKLQDRPMCGVPGHRSLADELEAKDLQLQLQATLVAQWHKKIEAVRGFVEASNAEMRGKGMEDV